MASTRSRVVPVAGTATSSWKVMTIPQERPRRSCRIETGKSGRCSTNASAAGTQNAGQTNTNSVQQIVAVPVQVDASALLGKKPGGEATAANAVGQFGVHDQVPVSGSEAKAKARAQKYIFDAANDVEEARKALDLKLTEKKDDDTIDLIHKDSK